MHGREFRDPPWAWLSGGRRNTKYTCHSTKSFELSRHFEWQRKSPLIFLPTVFSFYSVRWPTWRRAAVLDFFVNFHPPLPPRYLTSHTPNKHTTLFLTLYKTETTYPLLSTPISSFFQPPLSLSPSPIASLSLSLYFGLFGCVLPRNLSLVELRKRIRTGRK